MDKVGFAKYVKFFDDFCEALNERAEDPNKLFGTWGPKCKGNSELVNACLSPAYPLITAIELRSTLQPPPSDILSTLKGKLDKVAKADIEMMKQLGIKLSRYTPPTGLNNDCKFIHAASSGIRAFVNNTSEEAPIRMYDLAMNKPKRGPLGIFEHNTLLAASLLASQACVTQAEKNAAAAVVAEVAASVTPALPNPPPPYGSVTIGGMSFANPPPPKPGQAGGRRKTRRLSRGRHVRRSMSTRHRAKSHKRAVRKSQRSHR
jgi:hypothetical protein